MSVEAFESWVLNQPFPLKWEPVTPYDLESRRIAEGQHPRLILDVFKPKSVLDYGCGPGAMVALLNELGANVRGYEPYAQPFAYLPHLIRSDEIRGVYDLVICREVLEHVAIRAWRHVIPYLVDHCERYLYITTRFAKDPKDLLDFDTQDALDPTHTTLLHKDFVRAFFVMHGLKSRYDLEKQMDWQNKGRCLVFEKV